RLQGVTIVGSRKIFEKINRYAEKELLDRMRRLGGVKMSISYDDGSDTLAYRWEEDGFPVPREGTPTIFEPLSKGGGGVWRATAEENTLDNVCVEKALSTKEIRGLVLVEIANTGPGGVEGT